jgi:hypothetical protein
MGVVGPGVIVVVVGMVDLVVGHLLEGQGAVDDVGGDVVIGIGIS